MVKEAFKIYGLAFNQSGSYSIDNYLTSIDYKPNIIYLKSDDRPPEASGCKVWN